MRSSSLVSLLLLAAAGCGHTAATPPSPPTPAPVSRAAAYGGAERGGPSKSATPAAPAALDPSEAVTAKELASIPDPVPAREPVAAARQRPETAVAARRDAAAVPRREAAEITRRNPTVDGRRWIWRVQVFASPDRTLADRIAKEASSRFGEPSVIEFEDALYKVRLGDFPSEALAQALRERAVLQGFPGAFRMLSLEPVNHLNR